MRNSSSLFSSDCKSRLKFAPRNAAASVSQSALGFLSSVLSDLNTNNSREPAGLGCLSRAAGVSVLVVKRFSLESPSFALYSSSL